MDGMLLPLIIAAAVALVVFAIVQITASLTDPEKRKLKQRLSTEARLDNGSSGGNRSITLAEQDMGLFAGFSPIEKLGRKLLQAYPEASLNKFLMLCAGIAIFLFMILFLVLGNPVVALIAAVVGAYVPIIVVNSK